MKNCIKFVHIPKTAGVSILDGLQQSINSTEEGSDLWEIGGSNGTYHSKASEPSVRIEESKDITRVWSTYFTPVDFSFSFIRNPWDRFVSSYAYLVEKHNDEYEEYIKPFKSFKDFAINGSTDSLHFRPQTYWIDAPLDFIGRFEELQSHFDGLCKKLSLTSDILKNSNTTEHKHYSEYYDDESKNAVAEKYKEDIDCLGYSFKEYKHPTYSIGKNADNR